MSAQLDAAIGDPYYTKSVFDASMITPQAVQSQAASWADVLRYGIGRVADYKIATAQPTQPAVVSTEAAVRQATASASQFNGLLMWVLIGAAALVVLPALAKK